MDEKYGARLRVACAECKRLKLRCNRQAPCSSCIRRGCAAICPDGMLATGEGHQRTRAGASELRAQISHMSLRIRALEDALRASHSLHSTNPHPLLADGFAKESDVQTATDINEAMKQVPSPSSNEGRAEPLVHAFGSLSIDKVGVTRYYGSGAGSWRFLLNEMEDEPDDRVFIDGQGVLPQEIETKSSTFLASVQSDSFAENRYFNSTDLRSYLPPVDQAEQLEALFYRFGVHLTHCLPKDEFHLHIYPYFYGMHTGSTSPDPVFYHRLSVMFMVLASGSQRDPQQPRQNEEAEMYYKLARASLSYGNAAENPTIEAIQAMILMVVYLHLREPESETAHARWNLLGAAIRISHTMGLHRDPEEFDLPPNEVIRRRNLFWDMYMQDLWQAMHLGLPPAISTKRSDVKYIEPENPPTDLVFYYWRLKFSREILEDLHDQVLSAGKPSYDIILNFDARIRGYPLPSELQKSRQDAKAMANGGELLWIPRLIGNTAKENITLLLHRSYFDTATTESRDNPLGGPYGTSVVAAYRSAWGVVASTITCCDRVISLIHQNWHVWSGLFNAAIVLGTIVTRCPGLTFSLQALEQLDSARCLLATGVAGFGTKAQLALTTVNKLYEEARKSITSLLSAGALPNDMRDSTIDLSRLGGKTRRIIQPQVTTPATPELPIGALNIEWSGVHDTLRTYLQSWAYAESSSHPTYSNYYDPSHSFVQQMQPHNSAYLPEVITESNFSSISPSSSNSWTPSYHANS